jgi:hypothetical protein
MAPIRPCTEVGETPQHRHAQRRRKGFPHSAPSVAAAATPPAIAAAAAPPALAVPATDLSPNFLEKLFN